MSEFNECTEHPINFFHNQIILKIGIENSETYKEIFPRVHRRVITKIHFGVPALIQIFREYMDPSKQNCTLCPESLNDSIQIVYKNYFSRHKTFKVKISQKLLMDVTDVHEQDSLIEQTHETSHRGIRDNHAEIIRRYYFLNMKIKIRKFLILCHVCNKAKYERRPYKIKHGETPIPKKPLDIIHMDILISQPNIFLSVVDKLTRFGTLIPVKSRAIPDIRKAILKNFALHGTP